MAFKAKNVLFLPFFAKKRDVTPIKNSKISQKINCS